MLDYLRALFVRDLATLRTEVELYPTDALLWKPVAGCPNSGGNLVLHMAGNLRHFIGAELGGTSFVRDRDAEFSVTGLSRESLLEVVSLASDEVATTLASLVPRRLEERLRLPGHDRFVVTGLWLCHLSTHLAFHLGQLDYHRRTVSGDPTGAQAVSLPALLRFREGNPAV